MALKNTRPGGSESTEVFTGLIGSTVVMKIVSHDGKRPGQNGEYEVVTAHVLVVDGPKAYEFYKNLSITNAGITSSLVGDGIQVGDDIVATIGTYRSFGKNNLSANEATEAKFAEVAALFEQGDPFAHYLGDQAATPVGAQVVSKVAPVAAVASAKKPPWEK